MAGLGVREPAWRAREWFRAVIGLVAGAAGHLVRRVGRFRGW